MTASAIEEKKLGNEAYKQKDFENAHLHYDKAIELDPSDITFYANKAAVFFEDAKYTECIELCQKAVEVGRNHRAGFKLIAKALARIGNAYMKEGNQEEALIWLDKSLSEYRDPELLKRRRNIEKELNEQKRRAYINPEIAQEEKSKGNELFKKGQYPEAIKHYTEAIKRHPDNPVLYSNRAACYTKLMEFTLALSDCEACVKIDPKFIKGYIRMAAAHLAVQDFTKAQKAYEDALEIDPSNQEAMCGVRNCSQGMRRQNNADPEKSRQRSMQDPEIQAIVSDPAMRMVLEQMSNDPGAVREHLQNPVIAKKLLKLIDAGIVKMSSA